MEFYFAADLSKSLVTIELQNPWDCTWVGLVDEKWRELGFIFDFESAGILVREEILVE